MQGVNGPASSDVVVQQTVQQPAAAPPPPQPAEEQAERTHPVAEGNKGRFVDEFV